MGLMAWPSSRSDLMIRAGNSFGPATSCPLGVRRRLAHTNSWRLLLKPRAVSHVHQA